MSPLSFPLAPDGVCSGLGLVPLPENHKGLFIGETFVVQGYVGVTASSMTCTFQKGFQPIKPAF